MLRRPAAAQPWYDRLTVTTPFSVPRWDTRAGIFEVCCQELYMSWDSLGAVQHEIGDTGNAIQDQRALNILVDLTLLATLSLHRTTCMPSTGVI